MRKELGLGRLADVKYPAADDLRVQAVHRQIGRGARQKRERDSDAQFLSVYAAASGGVLPYTCDRCCSALIMLWADERDRAARCHR